MKNNLLNLKSFKSTDIDAQLPAHNDYLELVIMNKIEEGDFADFSDQITNVFERAFSGVYDDEDDEDDSEEYCNLIDENNLLLWERLRSEFKEESSESTSDRFLYAGYVDCMDEAIRFLVEEENISPEHPIVKNLKAHLEKSKDRVLQTFSSLEGDLITDGEVETLKSLFSGGSFTSERDFPLNPVFVGNVQDYRDSG